MSLEGLNKSSGKEIEVAHICLFEEGTGKVLIQHNKKNNKSAFVGGKCDGKNPVDTILKETGEEIGYSLLKNYIFEVEKNTRVIAGIVYNSTIFTGFLPKGFQAIDISEEGECYFYELENAPLDNFITGDTREIMYEIIKKCFDVLILKK